MPIWVDSSEARNHPGLIRLLGNLAEVCELEVGDFWLRSLVGKRVIIERKATSDLISSIANNHLTDQLRKMVELEAIPILLIEGFITSTSNGTIRVDSIEFKYPWQWLQNYLLSIQLAGTYILFSPNITTTANLLKALHMYFLKETHEATRGTFLTFDPLDPIPVQILSMFPTYGPEIARRVMSEFKTLRAFITASVEERKRVPGVGEKRARVIDSVLDMEV